MYVGGGPHTFPKMALESPVAALAWLHMFGVDSVVHRVSHQTRVLEVFCCGAYWLTCFLDLSRGASVQSLGLMGCLARCGIFPPGSSFWQRCRLRFQELRAPIVSVRSNFGSGHASHSMICRITNPHCCGVLGPMIGLCVSVYAQNVFSTSVAGRVGGG